MIDRTWRASCQQQFPKSTAKMVDLLIPDTPLDVFVCVRFEVMRGIPFWYNFFDGVGLELLNHLTEVAVA